MRIDMVFSGFPGKMETGFMEWSAVVLVREGGKCLLFDTGGTGKRVSILPRLAELGVSPTDIDIVFLSHFHSDHVYNFDYFSNAVFHLHEAEIPYAAKGQDPWQPPYFFAGLKATGRLISTREGDAILPGAAAVHLPGHTPGGMGLLLTTPDMPTTMIAGDAVKNLWELATGGAAMSLDQEATSDSIRKVRDMADRVIPGHDRILHVEKDRIVAVTTARETIVVPMGVVDADAPRRLELTLEPTWLPIT